MTTGLKAKIDQIEERLRALERSSESINLRQKQIIVMFKLILDRWYDSRKGLHKYRMEDIIRYMDQLVHSSLPEPEKRDVDLVQEIIKKGLK